MTFPIVLAHGVCRFDILWHKALDIDNNDDPQIDKLHYFKGIRTMLVAKGYSVYHSKVNWSAAVDTRAENLRVNIQKILGDSGAEKVNIIAHSMGGLDARHMMFNDRDRGRIHERIASLTTISTPHEGSPFADWGLNNIGLVPKILAKIGLDTAAFHDLRTDVCKAFNNEEAVINFEKECESGSLFQTYAGRQSFWGTFNVLKGPQRIIQEKEGENDGLVSVLSAKWRARYFKGSLDNCDHFNELGWWDPGQVMGGESADELLQRAHRFYAGVARNLP